jgi:hypothetical protein
VLFDSTYMITVHNGFMIRYTNESKTDPDYNSFWSCDNGIASRVPIIMIEYTMPSQTITEGTYRIKSAYSGKYLSVNESTDKVVQRALDGASNQLWTLVDKGSGKYELVSGASASGSNVLDVDNAGTENGTELKRFVRNPGPAQRFMFLNSGSGTYKIVPGCAPNKVLDVKGPSTAENTQIQLYDWGNVSQQKWILEACSFTAVWPTSGTGAYTFNSLWGFRQYDDNHHQGIDINVYEKPVYAIADGIVVTADTSLSTSQGIFIVIRHEVNGNVIYSRYMHLESIASGISTSSPNNIVSKGQPIGTSGDTGENGHTGSYHLHFQIQFENTSSRSKTVNPLSAYHPDDLRSTSAYPNNPNPLYLTSGSTYVFNPAFDMTYLNDWSTSIDTYYKNW